jgi:hypothetical protein
MGVVSGGRRYGWQWNYGAVAGIPPGGGGPPPNPEDLLPARTLNIAGKLVLMGGVYVVMQ